MTGKAGLVKSGYEVLLGKWVQEEVRGEEKEGLVKS